MIKVFVERRVTKKNYDKLIQHLLDLRTAALHQQGYVSGETLVKGDDPIDVITISSWISEDHWKAWITSEVRIELSDIIEHLIDGDEQVSIYKVPSEEEDQPNI